MGSDGRVLGKALRATEDAQGDYGASFAAGLLFGYSFGQTQFNIGFTPGIQAFTAAVLGGIGNIRGALLGGLALGLVQNISGGCFGTEWQDVATFAILVLVLMFRPTGILSKSVGGTT